MLFFDYEKVRGSLENLQKIKKEFEGYFIRIIDSINTIEKVQMYANKEELAQLLVKKEEIESFLMSLQQMIIAVEYAQNSYSNTGKKLVLECEKLFMNSKVPEKMRKISLEAYRKEMKDIYFGKRYENE